MVMSKAVNKQANDKPHPHQHRDRMLEITDIRFRLRHWYSGLTNPSSPQIYSKYEKSTNDSNRM